MAIFTAYTALVEPLTLDEAYLDVTEQTGDLTSATQAAAAIKRHIFATTRLTTSAGVSSNKFLAKLASDFGKPDGLTVVSPEQMGAFLDGMAIEKFLGVGKVTAARLRDMGILTGADLKRLSEEALRQRFGKQGSQLYLYNLLKQSEQEGTGTIISCKVMLSKTRLVEVGLVIERRSGWRCQSQL